MKRKMSILELYNLAQQSDAQCIEYTGLSREQFSELLPHFSAKVAKKSPNTIKLFAICYVVEKKIVRRCHRKTVIPIKL